MALESRTEDSMAWSHWRLWRVGQTEVQERLAVPGPGLSPPRMLGLLLGVI